MTSTLRTVNTVIEQLWPLENAEEWDAPGLVSGSPDAEITSIHLAVDAVAETVDEALDLSADLLLVHHPLLLRGVTTVAESTYKGALLARLIRGGCALVAAHTNADIVENGVCAVIASRLGLQDAVPLVAARGRSAVVGTGIGRVGTLVEPITLGRLALQLAELLPATATGIRVAGHYERLVSRVALCGGAGDSLLGEPGVRGADVYITSDLRHHPASEAKEQGALGRGPALVDVSHWASEWLWLDVAAEQLRAALPGVTVTVSELRTDPWDFVVTQ
ncbi:Nif3-like dinuclear metal center hexameric protein [Subtercola boreus]|uniref:GTP cyclohydrolase 1 type 2 homolog n=1 Tax=Subtercola boreus TaxID=120213 RepID=A0A3E0WC30_9MICO|nr:Nif3-like dinuclear metal center hexameric protein [Subtercola boreus]RFA20785.1 Nif3-like dinuclear metal center hexameric protein [Subtercola boreus]RFA20900.1 Nif3-like dinuclear metal center hexameric protein [Subtercola boreus]RFA27093.1 Nif3-like dinuclear metal center hexameric protein [Subtercola boreus]